MPFQVFILRSIHLKATSTFMVSAEVPDVPCIKIDLVIYVTGKLIDKPINLELFYNNFFN